MSNAKEKIKKLKLRRDIINKDIKWKGEAKAEYVPEKQFEEKKVTQEIKNELYDLAGILGAGVSEVTKSDLTLRESIQKVKEALNEKKSLSKRTKESRQKVDAINKALKDIESAKNYKELKEKRDKLNKFIERLEKE